MCACVRVCSTNLGFSVDFFFRVFDDTQKIKNRTPSTRTGSDTHAQRDTHAQQHLNVRVTTAASETDGVAAVSWIESLMIRRPFGSIDPYSIRETELHTDSRRSPFGSIDPNSIRETELHKESRRRQPRGKGIPTQPAASQGEGCCSSEGCRYA